MGLLLGHLFLKIIKGTGELQKLSPVPPIIKLVHVINVVRKECVFESAEHVINTQ
jgi:hypothetical protein